MELHFKLTEQDILDLNEYSYRTSPYAMASRGSNRLLSALLFVLLFFLLFAYRFGGKSVLVLRQLLFCMGMALAIGVLWYALFPALMRMRQRRSVRWHVKQGYYNEEYCPRTLALDENGMVTTATWPNRQLRETCAYAAVKIIGRDKSHYYFKTAGPNLFPLPFSAFASPEQQRQFEELLREKTGLEIPA